MIKNIGVFLCMLLFPVYGFGMHIAEGFLPKKWAGIWTIIFIPFLIIGYQKLKKQIEKVPKTKLLFSVVCAFVFVLSSFKIPSVAGSSSHLTGIALGAILFGAYSMSVAGVIVLLFQALLLAHGGITTLGANAFSMAVVGAFSAVWVFKSCRFFRVPQGVAVFTAALISDVLIYVSTSGQLALAFQSPTHGFLDNLIKFLSVFAVTQLPLAFVEGIFTVVAFNMISKYSKQELMVLNPSLY